MLNDLLGFSEDELTRVKVRFNQRDGRLDPVDEYEKDPERVNVNWFLNKNNLFSKGEIGICLLGIERDTWLLTTVKKILNVREMAGVGYDAEEIDRLKKYFGRIVIKCHTRMPQVNQAEFPCRLLADGSVQHIHMRSRSRWRWLSVGGQRTWEKQGFVMGAAW